MAAAGLLLDKLGESGVDLLAGLVRAHVDRGGGYQGGGEDGGSGEEVHFERWEGENEDGLFGMRCGQKKNGEPVWSRESEEKRTTKICKG